MCVFVAKGGLRGLRYECRGQGERQEMKHRQHIQVVVALLTQHDPPNPSPDTKDREKQRSVAIGKSHLVLFLLQP